MSLVTPSHAPVADPLDLIEQTLSDAMHSPARLAQARRALGELVESAREAARSDVASCAALLAGLLEIAECLPGDSSDAQVEAVVGFSRSGVETLRAAMADDEQAAQRIDQVACEARQRWGEYLDLLEQRDSTSGRSDDGPPGRGNNARTARNDHALPEQSSHASDAADIGRMLASLAANSAPTPDARTGQRAGVERSMRSPSTAADPAGADEASAPVAFSASAPPPRRLDVDAELLAAYLDDARRCLVSMEAVLLEFEADATRTAPLKQFCRELHTLKGASASIGLSDLARYLHELEDYVQASFSAASTPADVETMLRGVDAVQAQIGALAGERREPQDPAAEPSDHAVIAPDPAFLTSDSPRSDGEETVRVRSSQLDRLMDLLAELVILRNRRDARVTLLKDWHAELSHCAARLRTLGDGLNLPDAGLAKLEDERARPAGPHTAGDSQRSAYRANCLAELAGDVAEFARGLRELYEPLGEDNLAVSRLIGQFRQELMELQRVPVAGLFRRLQRGARDAAKTEGKQVLVQSLGEQTGLERSLQERLYEPLLHLVRNAVSHGIEDRDRRAAAGKSPEGTVTLAAYGDPTSMVVEVRDDGRGLDYEAIERRGRELGLLPAGLASRQQLAGLIFHPGFSTKRTVSEVSGRGVGMDVVSSAVERLRGQVEVDSTPGRGMTVRLRIPLRSGIEHALVVRIDGQMFALPMQCVFSAISGDREPASHRKGAEVAGSDRRPSREIARSDALANVRLRDLLGLGRTSGSPQEQTVIVGYGQSLATGRQDQAVSGSGGPARFGHRVGLLVDAVVGPEEVVVRSLPPLLRRHRLFAGVTLSGSGQIVLLLDGRALVELALKRSGEADRAGASESPDTSRPSASRNRVLVVDDSLSARRAMSRVFSRRGWQVVEAADGLEALDLLRSDSYSLVLTDLEMPRLGGLELLAEIKRGRRTRTLRVLLVSSRCDDQHRARAGELGADGYVAKPFNDASLAEALADIGLELDCATGSGSRT
jgi:chemotaxis protein histidine kinase CheA